MAKPPIRSYSAAARARLQADGRKAQAARVAAYLVATPEGATLRAIDAACDVGSVTKVLSVMRLELGYLIESTEIIETCSGGSSKRSRKKFFLSATPLPTQPDLFT